MSTHPQSLTPASEGYDKARRRFFNARVPDTTPAEIYTPKTTAEVASIIARAKSRGLKVGVRSGGHLFFCFSLVEKGILIDTKQLNKEIDFDTRTKIVSFSPGHVVEELATELLALGRFLPWGHSRTVGIGGFLLAGGQGCFGRGWGYTSGSWITQIEVVTPSGEVVIASKTQNPDLFWAFPGSGQGFFGVITRIWAKTIPSKTPFDTTLIVDSTDIFKPLLKWVLEQTEKVPKYGVDLFYLTFRSDMETPGDGEASDKPRIMFVINQTVYVDSIAEAKTIASPWDVLPQEFQPYVVERIPLLERTWPDLWNLQEKFQPNGNGERWSVDSILPDPKISNDELIDAITPVMYDLPTRLSTGTIAPLEYYPDEADQALSLPQKYYISFMGCWKDASRDAYIDEHRRKVFRKADQVSRGVYVADFNENQKLAKVMTDSALKKWLQIRAKWDPAEMFVGYRGFSKTLGDGARL